MERVDRPQVNQTTLSQEDDVPSAGHGEPVYLRLDVYDLLRARLQPRHVNLDVEVTDAYGGGVSKVRMDHSFDLNCRSLADDGIFEHYLEVFSGQDITVASRGDEQVRTGSGLLHRRHLVASHRGLESVDRIDLGHDHSGTIRPQRLGTLHMTDKRG
jgi:hypothetical protein